MGFFQKMAQAPERIKLGTFAASVFDEAPLDFIAVFYTALGRPSLGVGLGKVGAGSNGDLHAKMEVFLRGAKDGNSAYERMVRRIMTEAALWYAGQLPIEMVNGLVAVLREMKSRNYILDESFDPVALFEQTILSEIS